MTNTTGPAQQRDQPTKPALTRELERLIDAYGVATRASVRARSTEEEFDAAMAAEDLAYGALMEWIDANRGGVLR